MCISAGIRIFCTEERSQGKNKEKAFALLRSRLFELELEKQRSEVAAKRKSQVRGLLGAAQPCARFSAAHVCWCQPANLLRAVLVRVHAL